MSAGEYELAQWGQGGIDLVDGLFEVLNGSLSGELWLPGGLGFGGECGSDVEEAVLDRAEGGAGVGGDCVGGG